MPRARAMRCPLRLLLWSVLALGCGPATPEKANAGAAEESVTAPAYDPDVVLLVNDVELRASEVDDLAETIALVYPAYTLNHRRRLALGNTLLRRAALRARYPERRARALEACRSAQAELRADPAAPGIEVDEVHGDFRRLGIDLWSFAHGLTPGEWSEPFEHEGSLVLVQLVETEKGPEPIADLLTVRIAGFGYVPEEATPEAIEAVIDEVRLTILDPAWDSIVPERHKYRMKGDSPDGTKND